MKKIALIILALTSVSSFACSDAKLIEELRTETIPMSSFGGVENKNWMVSINHDSDISTIFFTYDQSSIYHDDITMVGYATFDVDKCEMIDLVSKRVQVIKKK
jgi:hypothetical protein